MSTIAPAPESASRGIPRFIYLARILSLCFFPVATVLLGDLVILYVPQAQEALLAFDDAAGGWYITSQAFAFEIAYVLWMICAWYVARLLVGRRFDPDLVGTCCSPPFAARLSKHLPRFLALLAGIPVIYFLLKRTPPRETRSAHRPTPEPPVGNAPPVAAGPGLPRAHTGSFQHQRRSRDHRASRLEYPGRRLHTTVRRAAPARRGGRLPGPLHGLDVERPVPPRHRHCSGRN